LLTGSDWPSQIKEYLKYHFVTKDMGKPIYFPLKGSMLWIFWRGHDF